MRDSRLQRIEAIVERQQPMPPEGDDDRLVLDGKDGQLGFLGACRKIGNGLALLPPVRIPRDKRATFAMWRQSQKQSSARP
jgi:hypothetical protein